MTTEENSSNIRLALVGCDYLTQLGLSHILTGASSLQTVGRVEKVTDALQLLKDGPLHLVLVDAGLGKAELVRTCEDLAALPKPPSVVVLGDIDESFSRDLIDAGAAAIIRRAAMTGDLPAVLRAIQSGEVIILDTQAQRSLRSKDPRGDRLCKEYYARLTIRECAIANGIAEGLSNASLALRLHLSEATIKVIVSKVMLKVGACNRVQLAVLVTKAQSN